MDDILADGMEVTGDDKYDGGGFEDPLVGNIQDALVQEEDEETGGQGDSAGKQGKDADGGEEQPAGAEEKEPKQDTGVADQEQQEPKEDQEFMLAKQLKEQNELLRTQLQMMQAQINQQRQQPQQQQAQVQAQPKKSPLDPEQLLDEIDKPSEQEWVDDPTAAAAKITAQVAAKVAENVKKEVGQQVSQDVTRQTEFRSRQERAWQSAVQLCPELAREGHPMRSMVAQFMGNPENKALRETPEGPFLAAAAAMVLNGYTPQVAQQPGNGQGQPQQQAQTGQDRQQRLRQGVMQGSGKGGKRTVQLSPQQLRAATMLGVSPQSMAEAVKAMGGE